MLTYMRPISRSERPIYKFKTFIFIQIVILYVNIRMLSYT